MPNVVFNKRRHNSKDYSVPTDVRQESVVASQEFRVIIAKEDEGRYQSLRQSFEQLMQKVDAERQFLQSVLKDPSQLSRETYDAKLFYWLNLGTEMERKHSELIALVERGAACNGERTEHDLVELYRPLEEQRHLPNAMIDRMTKHNEQFEQLFAANEKYKLSRQTCDADIKQLYSAAHKLQDYVALFNVALFSDISVPLLNLHTEISKFTKLAELYADTKPFAFKSLLRDDVLPDTFAGAGRTVEQLKFYNEQYKPAVAAVWKAMIEVQNKIKGHEQSYADVPRSQHDTWWLEFKHAAIQFLLSLFLFRNSHTLNRVGTNVAQELNERVAENTKHAEMTRAHALCENLDLLVEQMKGVAVFTVADDRRAIVSPHFTAAAHAAHAKYVCNQLASQLGAEPQMQPPVIADAILRKRSNDTLSRSGSDNSLSSVPSSVPSSPTSGVRTPLATKQVPPKHGENNN